MMNMFWFTEYVIHAMLKYNYQLDIKEEPSENNVMDEGLR